MAKKLCKSRTDIKLDGVCAGLADYLGMDVTMIRILWICAVLFGGSGVLLYIICALIMPREPEDHEVYYEDGDNRRN